MDIQNVYIFVSDALRYDFFPKKNISEGTIHKTVAGSTLSPSSFASIVSGCHLPAHGVQTFANQLPPEMVGILDIEGYNTAFYQRSSNDPIFDVLRQDEDSKQRVDEIEPPFINIERNLLTHSPYNIDEDDTGENSSASEFIYHKSENIVDLRSEYRDSVESVLDVFNSRIESIKDRGIFNNTLIIFTSDHGELLGEYTSVSHTFPMTPELVYVPSVIIHPGDKTATTGGVMSHVDIAATICEQLDVTLATNPTGTNVFDDVNQTFKYCGYNIPEGYTAFGPTQSENGNLTRHSDSIWDSDGGYVFREKPLSGRMKQILQSFSKQRVRIATQCPREYLKFLNYILHSSHCFGQPQISKNDARDVVRRLRKEGTQRPVARVNDEEQRRRLNYLGYK